MSWSIILRDRNSGALRRLIFYDVHNEIEARFALFIAEPECPEKMEIVEIIEDRAQRATAI